MTPWILAAVFLILGVVSEIRYVRRRQSDRRQAIEALARSVGIGPAVRAALALGWIDETGVRSDGDSVQIKLRPWWRFRP